MFVPRVPGHSCSTRRYKCVSGAGHAGPEASRAGGYARRKVALLAPRMEDSNLQTWR